MYIINTSINRYSVVSDEDYEPGSNSTVLKNLLNIKDVQIIEVLEERELERTGIELIELYNAHGCPI